MEIKEFQEKLSETLGLAVKNGKKIHVDTVEGIFGGNGLSEGQMQKVYEYLAIQGIQVEGKAPGSRTGSKAGDGSTLDREERSGINVRADNGSTDGSVANSSTDGRAENSSTDSIAEISEADSKSEKALTPEEAEYLEEYENTLKNIPPEKPGEREVLFQKALKKDEAAKKRLAELYMAEVMNTARELRHEEIFIGDMIAEGNIGLLTAMETLHEAEDFHAFLCGEIRNAILFMVEQQTDQKQRDNILVEKVRDLETKIKELLDDDDAKYSVEELAAFLDMEVDEIQAVLRLTGDDK
ncbi:RNA polymerase sigma factor RpoS [Blautia producta]|uniref:RNA polymerase sigma factor RpoS n=1 Tax=Blautia producta TaxID=33035 RepID=A0A4P6LYA2_9FIRM|nr:RNA polymerase subunit sigma-70 [Blautia producta]QBE95917.1 RNA polymerase sigma factor RpoS [Blautia producta]